MATLDRLFRSRRSLVRPVILAAAALLAPASVHADDITTSPYLSGDWGGLRKQLADRGIVFNLGYGNQLAHNFSGGTEHLTRDTDQWEFGTTVDMDKRWGWRGGTFQFTMTDRNAAISARTRTSATTC